MTYNPKWITGQAQGEWIYESGTGSSDPGTGKFKLNNANPTSATAMYINDENEAGIDLGTIIGSMGAGDALYIQETENSRRAQLCTISGAPVDNTGWWTISFSAIEPGVANVRTGNNCGIILQKLT